MRTMRMMLCAMLIGVAALSAPAQNPGLFQTTNPYYPTPNPFYFEGKVTWEYLKITTPKNFWEYLQRGIHKQDDLDDEAGAIADYQLALAGNSLQNGTCQIVTAATLVNGALPSTLTPPPCMFTVRLRLGHLLIESDPHEAVRLFKEVLQIDPLRLDTNALIGEAYKHEAEHLTDPVEKAAAFQHAIDFFKAELALSPVTAASIAQTGDLANNSRVHWELAEIYEEIGQPANQKAELEQYLAATKWHSDTYPWRIKLAEEKIKHLGVRQ